MKEYLDKYKEFKNNRRTVGFTKLGFWVIFFGIIFLIYFLPSSNNTSSTGADIPDNTHPIVEVEDDIPTNYSFEYFIDGQKYTGTYYENDIELIGSDISFYIKMEDVYMDKEGGILPDCTYLHLKGIDSLIKESELESTTSYKNGKEEYKYINKDEEGIETYITYIKNVDKSINVSITKDDKVIEVYFFDLNKASLLFNDEKYIYSLEEVENEH